MKMLLIRYEFNNDVENTVFFLTVRSYENQWL